MARQIYKEMIMMISYFVTIKNLLAPRQSHRITRRFAGALQALGRRFTGALQAFCRRFCFPQILPHGKWQNPRSRYKNKLNLNPHKSRASQTRQCTHTRARDGICITCEQMHLWSRNKTRCATNLGNTFSHADVHTSNIACTRKKYTLDVVTLS